MKKIFFILVFLFTAVATINAQDISNHAIGLRFGDNGGLSTEISYQKALGDSNRLEAGLSWRSAAYFNAIKLTGLYQWVWDLDGGFNWYAGAGGGFGSWKIKTNYTGDGGTYLFVAGDVGIEYKFDIPLLLSLDFRPEIGFSDFNNDLGFDIAFAVRYTFD